MEKKFTSDHEWVAIDGDVATIGVTDYAQQQMGDVVFVDLPQIDKDVSRGEEIGVVESVKAASEIYAPVSGKILAANDALQNEPNLVNESAEENGWLARIQISNPQELDELLSAQAYAELIG